MLYKTDGCKRKLRARKMCMKHYLQWHRKGSRQIMNKRLPTTYRSIYKHGISTETARNMTSRDYVRELVRTRDGWTCQNPECKEKWKQGQRRFDVHHLKGNCGKMSGGVDRTVDIPNLLTLCHKCHFNHPEHSFRARAIQKSLSSV